MRILGIILRNITLVANIIVAILLLLGFANAKIDTSLSPNYISLIAFAMPFLIVFNIGFFVFWLVITKRKWYSLISLIILIISFPVTKNVIGIHLFGADKAVSAKETIKIMTYNVHLFDLGEWTKDKSTQRKITDFFKEENADIMCFQEYYVSSKDSRLPLTEIISNLGYGHYYFMPMREMNKKRINIESDKNEKFGTGIAIFSKFPLSNEQVISIGNPNYRLLKVEVEVNKTNKFALLVTHLQSFQFGKDDREFIDNVSTDQNLIKEQSDASRHILYKMKSAISMRAAQANNVRKAINEQTLPVIVCGDMNDIPASYAYTTVKGELKDPFTQKGFGMGRTFRHIFPTLRIDHIFYDAKTFTALNYRIPDVAFSDHKPVVVELEISN